MMQFLMVNLTALSLAGHALAGCCWHHSHPGQPAGETAPAVKPVVVGCHGHRHDEPGSESHHHEPGSHHGCGEMKCSLTARDGRPQLPSPLNLLAVAREAAPLLGMAVGTGSLTGGVAVYRPPGSPGPALHLLYGVIVV